MAEFELVTSMDNVKITENGEDSTDTKTETKTSDEVNTITIMKHISHDMTKNKTHVINIPKGYTVLFVAAVDNSKSMRPNVTNTCNGISNIVKCITDDVKQQDIPAYGMLYTFDKELNGKTFFGGLENFPNVKEFYNPNGSRTGLHISLITLLDRIEFHKKTVDVLKDKNIFTIVLIISDGVNNTQKLDKVTTKNVRSRINACDENYEIIFLGEDVENVGYLLGIKEKNCVEFGLSKLSKESVQQAVAQTYKAKPSYPYARFKNID